MKVKRGGAGINDRGRMKRRESEEEGGFIYPAGRSVAASPACMSRVSLEAGRVSSRPKWQRSPYSDALTPPQFAPEGEQTVSHFRRLTQFPSRGYRSQLPSPRSISASSHQVICQWPPSSRLKISANRECSIAGFSARERCL